jgi:hypothetical protein
VPSALLDRTTGTRQDAFTRPDPLPQSPFDAPRMPSVPTGGVFEER